MNRILLTIALVSLTLGVSAQTRGTTRSKTRTAQTIPVYTAANEPYNRFSISYDNTHLGASDKLEGYFNDEDAMNLNGFGFEYLHGFSLNKRLPLYLEAGLKVQFGFGSVTDSGILYGEEFDLIMKMQQISFSVPLNLTYRFHVGDDLYIAPYFGFNFKLHALSRLKDVFVWEDDDLQEEWEDINGKEEWASVFSKKDMGDKDLTWNRFQMGWHLGAGITYKSFYFGLQYGTDFIKAYKYKKYSISSGNFSAKIGVEF